MRARVYASRAQAEAAQAALDREHGLPAVHTEGTGPADYALSTPGRAAARLRDRGVRTEHYVPIVLHPDGDRFAIAAHDGGAEELDASWSRPIPRS